MTTEGLENVSLVVQDNVRQPYMLGGKANFPDPFILLWIPHQPVIIPYLPKTTSFIQIYIFIQITTQKFHCSYLSEPTVCGHDLLSLILKYKHKYITHISLIKCAAALGVSTTHHTDELGKGHLDCNGDLLALVDCRTDQLVVSVRGE